MSSHARFAQLVIAFAIRSALVSAPAAAQTLRSSQVPVAGDSLQNLLHGTYAQTLDVRRDQLAIDRLPIDFFTRPLLDLASSPPAVTVGVYDPAQPAARLMPVFAPGTPLGAMVEFTPRQNPDRFLILVIDQAANILRRDVYPGVRPASLAVYVTGPDGTFYSEDARNAGSAAQALWFADTQFPYGSGWIGLESSIVTAEAPGDYADVVLGIGTENVDPVRKTSWGALKARFH